MPVELAAGFGRGHPANTGRRSDGSPNIILIMAADMGFSDIGCYDGEIDTPNLDRLAARCLRFTQFYNTGRCCPALASLMTGLWAHQTGMGAMTGNAGFPGYRGDLNRNCVTIAQAVSRGGLCHLHVGQVASDQARRLLVRQTGTDFQAQLASTTRFRPFLRRGLRDRPAPPRRWRRSGRRSSTSSLKRRRT